jgi:hypothetical protein
VFTMIDNILGWCEEGQEKTFVDTVRAIARRTQQANLQTTPRAETILEMSDKELLLLAEGENTFLGEVYTWDNEKKERTIRNSLKTVAKLRVALRKEKHTFRTFVALISLVLYAMHTTGRNPASAFHILRAYRGAAAAVSKCGGDWDCPLPFIAKAAREQLMQIGQVITTNAPARISRPHRPTYEDGDYTDIIFTDASASGWAATHRAADGSQTLYQQQWINSLSGNGRCDHTSGESTDTWTAKFSAHAEPGAILAILQHLDRLGRLGKKIAIVSDHFPIEHAQRGSNGFGGIGRGQALNRLYEFVYSREAETTFFFISGKLNPVDEPSRNFGAELADGRIRECSDANTRIPPLQTCFSHLCESGEPRPQWMK